MTAFGLFPGETQPYKTGKNGWTKRRELLLFLLRLARSDGRGGRLLRAGRAFGRCHRRGGHLTSSATTEFSTLRALLAKELQNLRWKFFLRHQFILNRVLAD